MMISSYVGLVLYMGNDLFGLAIFSLEVNSTIARINLLELLITNTKNGPFGLTIKRIVDLDCPENVWFGKTYGKWIRPLHESFSWPSISGELLLNKDLWGWALFGSPPVHWSFECPCRCLRLFFIMNNLYSKSWCENVTIPMPLFKKTCPPTSHVCKAYMSLIGLEPIQYSKWSNFNLTPIACHSIHHECSFSIFRTNPKVKVWQSTWSWTC